jgi:hypothetical protein
MPVHPVKGGGQQWGNHGHIYHGANAAAKAAAQGRAAYANGYRGAGHSSKPAVRKPRGRG